jgi:hypothetical protein
MCKVLLCIFLLFTLTFIPCACNPPQDSDNNGNDNNDNGDDDNTIPTGTLTPSDFVYLGAFRLPDGTSEVKSFEYGGLAMTYYPGGDPAGANDGYPGSLYIAGHQWQYQLAEVSIPVPVVSASKNITELNTAGFIQQFQDIYDVGDLEIPRAGLAYLPKQGSQSTDKLYLCWGYHMQQEPADLTHGWCELNLSNSQVKKAWYLSGLAMHIQNMSTNDYMFEIPKSWADAYTSGLRLATGRFRDGGWSGQGPSIFAIGPWNHGNPPANGTGINNTALLLYTSTMDFSGENHTMNNYHNSDEWTGGVWLTAGDKAAVIFTGTKGFGDCWYGNPNGPCESCENRGWWSTSFRGQIIFYNPADLAQVASGATQPYQPQPYTTMEIDNVLFDITSAQQKNHTGDIAFDRENKLLYVIEYGGEGEKPLVHVWRIGG